MHDNTIISRQLLKVDKKQQSLWKYWYLEMYIKHAQETVVIRKVSTMVESMQLVIYFSLSFHWEISSKTNFIHKYTGGPIKNERAYFQQYVDAITAGISVYKVTSPEKNNTKINNFGSVVCFLGHILYFCETMSRPKIFPFQLKLDVNECHIGLPQLWAVIHLFVNAHC